MLDNTDAQCYNTIIQTNYLLTVLKNGERSVNEIMTNMQIRLREERTSEHTFNDDTHYGTFEDLCYARLMNDDFDESEEFIIYDYYGM